jgi:hypothetical protein
MLVTVFDDVACGTALQEQSIYSNESWFLYFSCDPAMIPPDQAQHGMTVCQ